jgi:SAM-dependent methyltransferase
MQSPKQSNQPPVSIETVRRFWDDNPLLSGELGHEVGTQEWFEECERTFREDVYLGQDPDPIFTRDVKPDDRILDVGCGPGFWVRFFLRKGFTNVSACDLTPTAVELTKKSLELFGLGSGANVQVGNAEDLPYEDETFDHVNCQGVIHHTPNTAQCIREFHRVLKPGGSVCFSVYYKVFLLRHPKLLRLLSGVFTRLVKVRGRGREQMFETDTAEEIVRQYDGAANPVGKAYSLPELREMVAGLFEIKEVGRHYFPFRWLKLPLPQSIQRWLHYRHGLMIVLRCVKQQ